MANLKFGGSLESNTESHTLDVYKNDFDQIYLEINMGIDDGWTLPHYIVLDIDTAVQMAKQLRRSIAQAKEANNG